VCRADTARGLTQLLEQVGSTPAPAPHIHWALLKFAAVAIILQAQTTPENLTWTPATVVENRHVGLSVKCPARWCKFCWPDSHAPASACREASADGSVRTLLLSVEDRVNFLEGRKVRHVQQDRRWIDDYRWVAGRHVCTRCACWLWHHGTCSRPVQ
jgi:hypothetical protein